MEKTKDLREGAEDYVAARSATARLERAVEERLTGSCVAWECAPVDPIRSRCAFARMVIRRPQQPASGRLHSRDITLEAHGVTVNDALDGLAKLLGVTE